jgi:integrase
VLLVGDWMTPPSAPLVIASERLRASGGDAPIPAAWSDRVLWRAGLRIHEALALNESDLDHRRGSLLVRSGKGRRRREVGMDEWAWEQLQPWTALRLELPVGPLFCVINGPTGGRPWSPAAARAELRRVAATAGVRRRFAPHQLRHAHAVEMAHEGVPLIVIQRQLGHSNLGITSIYLQGIDNAEIIEAVHARRAPMVSVSASLRLRRSRRRHSSREAQLSRASRGRAARFVGSGAGPMRWRSDTCCE